MRDEVQCAKWCATLFTSTYNNSDVKDMIGKKLSVSKIAHFEPALGCCRLGTEFVGMSGPADSIAKVG
jgi:hypothetical protein